MNRWTSLLLLPLCAGALVASTACVVAPEKEDPGDDDDESSGDDDDGDTTEVPGDDDDTPPGDDDDTPPGDDDDTPPGDDDDTTLPPHTDTYTYIPQADTALALAMYSGSATVTNQLHGTEAFVVVGLPTSTTLCEWTWDSHGVATTAGQPCTDYDGNACDFTFDVYLDNGAETDGDCVGLFGYTLGVDGGGPFPYGYIGDYQAYGGSYGAWMMYYFAGYDWYAVTPYTSFSGGTWEYDWPVGYVVYVP